MAKPKNSELDEVQRRMRAAIMLAGIEWDELAARINEPNYGEQVLQRLNARDAKYQGKIRPAFARTAHATGLPLGFFTAPLAELGPSVVSDDRPAEELDPMRQMLARLATLEAAVFAPSGEESGTTRQSRPGTPQ